jgi:pilus assembly protein Flp/PilA
MLSKLEERGQGLLEYAMILVFVVIIVLVILTLLGPALSRIYSNVIEIV